MTELSFKLEVFEGPLDLLLFLISKHKLNICDIEISKLLEQYLDYMDKMREQDMELAGEFLEMAARLIYIKTASLLPQREEAEEMKKELEGRLIEYSLCKRAAELLRSRFIGDSVFVRAPMKLEADNTYRLFHDSELLIETYNGMNIRKRDMLKERETPVVFDKIVKKRIVSVTSKIIFVLKRLYSGEDVEMNSLYSGSHDRSERVATFLAVLELTKSGRVRISDDNSTIKFNRERHRNTEASDAD